MEEKKIYLSYQIKALLPGDLYKTLDILFSYQKEGCITYSKRNAEYLHMDVAVVEQCIQTAINYKIIAPEGVSGGVYKFRILGDTIERSKIIQLTDIPNKPLLRVADEITFKNNMKQSEPSTTELLEEIRVLKEKLMNQVKKDNNDGNLPW